jgi:hypothetical protein
MLDRESLELYVSCCHEEASRTVVETLRQACEARNIKLRLDSDEIRHRKPLTSFTQSFDGTDAVVILLSYGYLKSEHCMLELLELERDGRFAEKMFPVSLEDCDGNDPVSRLQIVSYWQERTARLQKDIQALNKLNHIEFCYKVLTRYCRIQDEIDRVMQTLGDMASPIGDAHIDISIGKLLDDVETRLRGAASREQTGPSRAPGRQRRWWERWLGLVSKERVRRINLSL